MDPGSLTRNSDDTTRVDSSAGYAGEANIETEPPRRVRRHLEEDWHRIRS